MSGFMTQARQSVRGFVLQPATESISATVAALNAAPLIKLARALDTAGFALRALMVAGIADPDARVQRLDPDGQPLHDENGPVVSSVTVGEAWQIVVDFAKQLPAVTTTVPAGMDESAVQALQALVDSAQKNTKSLLVSTAGAKSVVKVEK